MASTKPKQKTTTEVATDAFISGALDADAHPRGVQKGNQQQVIPTIAPTLLAKVDEPVSELGQSCAAVINMAIYCAAKHKFLKER